MSIIDKAKTLVDGDRRSVYGDPIANFTAIARLWSTFLNTKFGFDPELGPTDVAQMMMLLKQARLMNSPTHEDSLIDLVGYGLILDGVVRSGDKE